MPHKLPGAAGRIQTFAKHRNNFHILLRMDNSTVVAYVNKTRGAHTLQTYHYKLTNCGSAQ